MSHCTFLSSCVIDSKANLLLRLEATMGDQAREAKTDDDEEEAPIISPREVSTTTLPEGTNEKNPAGLRSILSPIRTRCGSSKQSRRALPAGWWVSMSR